MEMLIFEEVIGGVITAAAGILISKSIRKSYAVGNLKFGGFMIFLGWILFGMAVFCVSAFVFDGNVRENGQELFSVIGLIIFSVLSGAYCIEEYFFVGGTYNSEEIIYRTLWTGKKHERWSDLKSAKFNSLCCWYTLTFQSGSVIRLSSYLSGIDGVLKLIDLDE